MPLLFSEVMVPELRIPIDPAWMVLKLSIDPIVPELVIPIAPLPETLIVPGLAIAPIDPELEIPHGLPLPEALMVPSLVKVPIVPEFRYDVISSLQVTSDPVVVHPALTSPEYIPNNPADSAIAGIAFLKLMSLCGNGGALAF